MRITSHAPIPYRREGRQFFDELAVLVEEFVRLVTLHPRFKDFQMFRIVFN
jgi:hypothetical protein